MDGARKAHRLFARHQTRSNTARRPPRRTPAPRLADPPVGLADAEDVLEPLLLGRLLLPDPPVLVLLHSVLEPLLYSPAVLCIVGGGRPTFHPNGLRYFREHGFHLLSSRVIPIRRAPGFPR